MDGIELVQRIRANFSQSPVMMVVTAHATDQSREKALDAGADDYLAKPCTPRDLLEHLGLCFERRRRSHLFPPEPLSVPVARPASSTPGGVFTIPPGVDREQLFAEFQPLVRRLIRQYGNDAETRKDLEGEVYYLFCSLLHAYDPTRGVPLKPDLVRNLTASVYTLVRSQWRRQRREVSLDWDSGRSEPTDGHDPSTEWDHDMVTEQVLQALPKIIAHLPTRQRQVVISRYYDGESFEQIALRLNIQPATVRSLLRHGLNALRAHIGQAGLV
jgi:RNA polymerase sigma factor (sigma-70 family)